MPRRSEGRTGTGQHVPRSPSTFLPFFRHPLRPRLLGREGRDKALAWQATQMAGGEGSREAPGDGPKIEGKRAHVGQLTDTRAPEPVPKEPIHPQLIQPHSLSQELGVASNSFPALRQGPKQDLQGLIRKRLPEAMAFLQQARQVWIPELHCSAARNPQCHGMRVQAATDHHAEEDLHLGPGLTVAFLSSRMQPETPYCYQYYLLPVLLLLLLGLSLSTSPAHELSKRP